MKSRRDALKALIMAAAAARAVEAQHEHGSTDLVQVGKRQTKPVAFTADELALTAVLTDLIIPLRVSAEQEEIGLDLSQHGEVMQDVSAFAPANHAEEVLAKIA